MTTSDRIDEARQVGLKALNPSSKQLEHGLELHNEFIVFDSYGFSPTSVPDPAVLSKAIDAGAWPNELKAGAVSTFRLMGCLSHSDGIR